MIGVHACELGCFCQSAVCILFDDLVGIGLERTGRPLGERCHAARGVIPGKALFDDRGPRRDSQQSYLDAGYRPQFMRFPLSKCRSVVLERPLHFENHHNGRAPAGFPYFRDTGLIGEAQALDARPPYSRSFAAASEWLCVPNHGDPSRAAGQGVANPAADNTEALRKFCATRNYWGLGVSPDSQAQWLAVETTCFRSACRGHGDSCPPASRHARATRGSSVI